LDVVGTGSIPVTMNQGHDPSSESRDAASGLDVLSDVLRSVRLNGAMLFLVDATTPWCTWAPQTEAFRRVVLPDSQHLVSYHIVTRGHCWAGLRGTTPERLEAGDALVIPHGDAYFLADPAEAEESYGPEDAVAFLRKMAAGELPTAVDEGGGGAQHTQFICGFLGCSLRPFNPVLAALPRVVHLRTASPSAARMRHLIEFAQCELREPASGGQAVLLRLAELMFVEVVRRCIETMPAVQSGWLAALRDPLIGRALARLHATPAHPWSLEALSADVGTSRSVLAERFNQVVGQPPMQYLTAWRMQLASELLDDRTAKVKVVAAAVGYDSEAAFSRAFKKMVGVSPLRWRERVR
jgi:AraC-like DNA-binding protein